MRYGGGLMTNPLLVKIPEQFESRRLILRAHRSGDGPVLHDALVESIAELRRFLWMLPWVAEEQTQDSAEIRCRRCAANFLSRTDLPYLAFERSTGRLVGGVGLHRTDWDVPKTEVGYWIRTSAVGNGYAAEGVQVLVSWAFEQLGAQRVELIVDEQNRGSRNVAERCGFVLEAIRRNELRAPDGTLCNTCIYARLPTKT